MIKMVIKIRCNDGDGDDGDDGERVLEVIG